MTTHPTTYQTPAIGRVVHYVTQNGDHRSARISAINRTAIGLHVDVPEMLAPVRYFPNVPYDPAGAPGTWHWPESTPPAPTPPSSAAVVP